MARLKRSIDVNGHRKSGKAPKSGMPVFHYMLYKDYGTKTNTNSKTNSKINSK